MSNAKPPKTLDVEQQQTLLSALLRKGAPHKTAIKGIRNYLIGCLMLDAGLRVGEVVALQVSDLFFAGQYVKTLVVRPAISKNHKERSIPVSTRLANAIEHFGQVNTCLFTGLGSDPAFTISKSKTQITTRQVENIISSAAEKSMGRRINPHMLRHTFASRLLRVTNMRTVQQLLGHTCITSTQIYTHPNEDDKREAVEKVSNAVQDYMSERFGPSS